MTTKEQPNKVKAPAKPISRIIEAMFAILVSLLRTLRSAFRTHTDLGATRQFWSERNEDMR